MFRSATEALKTGTHSYLQRPTRVKKKERNACLFWRKCPCGHVSEEIIVERLKVERYKKKCRSS